MLGIVTRLPMRLVGHRNRCVGTAGYSLPGHAQQSHATHTFYGNHKINGAKNRPPTAAQPIHPGKSVKPTLAFDRGPITTKPAGLHLKTQKPEPVTQTPIADEVALLRQIAFAKTGPQIPVRPPLPKPPKAHRVQAADNDAPLWYQDALYFPQTGMGVSPQFERMRRVVFAMVSAGGSPAASQRWGIRLPLRASISFKPSCTA